MIQIRLQTFETNSSSTHTLVIVSPEDWQRFKSDPDLYMNFSGQVLTYDEANQEWNENCGLEDDPQEVNDEELSDAHIVHYKEIAEEYCEYIYKELPDGGAAISCYYYD